MLSNEEHEMNILMSSLYNQNRNRGTHPVEFNIDEIVNMPEETEPHARRDIAPYKSYLEKKLLPYIKKKGYLEQIDGKKYRFTKTVMDYSDRQLNTLTNQVNTRRSIIQIILAFFGLDEDTYKPLSKEGTRIQEELPEVLPFLRIWKNKAHVLRVIQILLGSSSVIFSLVTTTLLTVGTADNNGSAKISAFIAAVSIGLMTAFDVGTKSNNMMNAWRLLASYVMQFNKGQCGAERVIAAYIEGEKLIGNVSFQQQGVNTGVDK